MLKMYFLISTYNRSKSVLLSFPQKENSREGKYNKPSSTLNPNELITDDMLTEVFCSTGKQRHILDLTVGNLRYIGFPYELENKNYFSAKMVINDEDEDMYVSNSNEKKKKIIKLKMFTIVLVFYSFLFDYTKLSQIYNSLEAFSKFLTQYLT